VRLLPFLRVLAAVLLVASFVSEPGAALELPTYRYGYTDELASTPRSISPRPIPCASSTRKWAWSLKYPVLPEIEALRPLDRGSL